jgi:ACS family pantothenate transporter-like MFS transporter
MRVLSSWYVKDELAKRLTLFEFSSSIGSMFSGSFQAAVYTHLNGHGGLKGWQWLFVVDGECNGV